MDFYKDWIEEEKALFPPKKKDAAGTPSQAGSGTAESGGGAVGSGKKKDAGGTSNSTGGETAKNTRTGGGDQKWRSPLPGAPDTKPERGGDAWSAKDYDDFRTAFNGKDEKKSAFGNFENTKAETPKETVDRIFSAPGMPGMGNIFGDRWGEKEYRDFREGFVDDKEKTKFSVHKNFGTTKAPTVQDVIDRAFGNKDSSYEMKLINGKWMKMPKLLFGEEGAVMEEAPNINWGSNLFKQALTGDVQNNTGNPSWKQDIKETSDPVAKQARIYADKEMDPIMYRTRHDNIPWYLAGDSMSYDQTSLRRKHIQEVKDQLAQMGLENAGPDLIQLGVDLGIPIASYVFGGADLGVVLNEIGLNLTAPGPGISDIPVERIFNHGARIGKAEEKLEYIENDPIQYLLLNDNNKYREYFVQELLEKAKDIEDNPVQAYLDHDENDRFNRELVDYYRRIAWYNQNFQDSYDKFLKKMEEIDEKYKK